MKYAPKELKTMILGINTWGAESVNIPLNMEYVLSNRHHITDSSLHGISARAKNNESYSIKDTSVEFPELYIPYSELDTKGRGSMESDIIKETKHLLFQALVNMDEYAQDELKKLSIAVDKFKAAGVPRVVSKEWHTEIVDEYGVVAPIVERTSNLLKEIIDAEVTRQAEARLAEERAKAAALEDALSYFKDLNI